MASKQITKSNTQNPDMTREYVIGIRAGLEYAVMVLDMEQKRNGTMANARKEIKSDIADITRTLEMSREGNSEIRTGRPRQTARTLVQGVPRS